MIRIHLNAAPTRAIPRSLLERALGALLRDHNIDRAELSVTFLDDDAITLLHERHLGRPGPTDVIAFALHGPTEDPLGDIYIGHAQASRQAHALGIAEREELVRLAIHGALHVLGYTHSEGAEREAGRMYRIQEALLQEALVSADAPGPPRSPELPETTGR